MTYLPGYLAGTNKIMKERRKSEGGKEQRKKCHTCTKWTVTQGSGAIPLYELQGCSQDFTKGGHSVPK